jgi:hypothetical protein
MKRAARAPANSEKQSAASGYMIGEHMIDCRRPMESSGLRTGRSQHVDAFAMEGKSASAMKCEGE